MDGGVCANVPRYLDRSFCHTFYRASLYVFWQAAPVELTVQQFDQSKYKTDVLLYAIHSMLRPVSLLMERNSQIADRGSAAPLG
jgi:hypothetical protein